MKLVLKLTGKLFREENLSTLERIVSLILEKYAEGNKIAVIVGGGDTARKYIQLGESLGLGKTWLDMLGIEASRLNALLLAALIGDKAYRPIPRSVDDLMNAWASGKIVVAGGIQPGQSTNAVAAFLAELINADLLVNATKVDGVYDKDPSRHPDAKILNKLTIEELGRILEKHEHSPGKYELLDLIAFRIVKRSRIKLVFVNAFKVDKIKEVLEGNRNVGTWIYD